MKRREWRESGRALCAALCLAPAALAGAVDSPGPAPAWQHKVHPRVIRDAAAGTTDFLVVLRDQADLAPAAGLATRAARGRYVHDTLRALADRTQAPVIAELEAAGLEYRSYWIANMLWVRGSAADVERLARRADVRRVSANPVVQLESPVEMPAGAGTESLAAVEWGIAKTRADQLWVLGYDGAGIVIGGQDTGYDWDHPALIGKYRGWDGQSADHSYNWHDSIHSGGGVCGSNSPQPCDDHGHGTHTMGTMVGDDGGANRVGMSPGSKWIGCRNMDQGAGTPATYTECFQWFVAPTDASGQNPDPARAPHVINNSWACPPEEGCDVDTLEAVVQNTRAAGIVVVVSAGNAGSGCSSVVDPPAIYDASFSVGATDSGDGIASFSSRGPVDIDGSGRLKPDVSAPGVNVRSSVPGGGYGTSSGTSMAGPHVAGLVALLLGARPDLIGQVADVEQLIEASAFPLTSGQSCGGVPGGDVPNAVYGYGRIDALETVTGDADDDGVANVDDCRPLDGGSWTAPDGPVALALAQDSTTELSWSPLGGEGALAPRYDLLRSGLADDFSAADCLVINSQTTAATDGAAPGSIFYYLVRIKNACGSSLGADSDGQPRTGRGCLSPGG